MKHQHPRTHRVRQAMSLIELLVVISIIGVLAGLILPAVGNVKKKARITQAVKDMGDIKGAISVYQSEYHRLPASGVPVAPDTIQGASTLGTDFTFGTTGTGYGTNIYNNNNVGYQANNAELMAILTGATPPGYTPHSSVANNGRNPRRTQYLNVKSSSGSGATAGAGLGTDGVMRDPWGNPYIIALDLNYDSTVSNAVYRLQAVAQVATGSPIGHNGLVGVPPTGNNNNYTLRDSAMIFSFGPDGMVDFGTKADSGVNKDNVLSWK